MRGKFFSPLTLLCGAALGAAACAGNGAPAETPYVARGWFAQTPQGEAEIIGEFADRADCEAAVDDWLSRQLVGASVHGECIPADR